MYSKGFKKATTIFTTNEILLFFGNFAAAVSRVETCSVFAVEEKKTLGSHMYKMTKVKLHEYSQRPKK